MTTILIRELVLALVLAVVLAQGGCRNETSTDLDGSDSPGKTGSARRVASLAPHLTEILRALELPADRLVATAGTLRFADPAGGSAPVRLGSSSNPDLVALVAARPDLVLLPPNESLERFLEVHGLRYEVFPMRELADVVRAIRRIGRLVGRESPARAIEERMTRDLEAIGDRLRGVREVTFVLAIRRRPPLFVGSHPFLNSLPQFSGARNALAGEGESYAEVSAEDLARRGVELVVDVEDALAGESPVADREIRWWREWGVVPEHGVEVRFLDGDDLFMPSPRIVRGLDALAKLLHPEAYE